MDLTEASDGGKGRSGPLAVNKSSSKIGKGMRRPVAQPRPAPQVYKTDPGDFRSLVQQLTGTSPPMEPSTAAPKPASSRLQKIAPPPLRPTFSYPTLVQSQSGVVPPLSSPTGLQNFNSLPFGSLSPLASQRIFPLSFSPLPALSPSDQVWVNSLNPMESPGNAAMRQLARTMSVPEVRGSRQETGAVPPPLQISPSPRFYTPFSPKFSIPFGLPSPTGLGIASGFGLGSVYGGSNNFSPTAALAMDNTFSFPELEFMSTSGFS